MASNWTVCSACNSRKIIKASEGWCSEYDEVLCDQCKAHNGTEKSSRNHSIIPVTDDHQKISTNVLEITQTCQKHKEQYQSFCKKHDCPCCRRCIIETHNDCEDLTAINEFAQNTKASYAFFEVERILAEMLENIKNVHSNCHKNLNCIQEQKRNIETEIKETRKIINDHLDQLYENLMAELNSIEADETLKIKQLVSLIEQNNKEITDLQSNFNNIKQHASEIQAFLSLKHIEKEVSEKEDFIKSVVKDEDMKIKTISLTANDEVQNISRIQKFGCIGVESKLCEVFLSGNKYKQAQIMVPVVPSKCICYIKLSNKKELNLQSKLIRGCAMLPNGKMMFCCHNDRKIVALNSNGTDDFVITLNDKVCDIAFIEEENAIAVSTAYREPYIHIIDLNRKMIKRSVRAKTLPFGIAVRKGTLVYCAELEGIIEAKLNNNNYSIFKPEMRLVTHRIQSFSYIAVNDDIIYFTNKDSNSVSCYDIHGTLMMEFKDKKIRYPQGIAIDSYGNLYVACMSSHRVVLISRDGKDYRIILSASDGLKRPRALHFSQQSNKLLVANENGCAFVYDVS